MAKTFSLLLTVTRCWRSERAHCDHKSAFRDIRHQKTQETQCFWHVVTVNFLTNSFWETTQEQNKKFELQGIFFFFSQELFLGFGFFGFFFFWMMDCWLPLSIPITLFILSHNYSFIIHVLAALLAKDTNLARDLTSLNLFLQSFSFSFAELNSNILLKANAIQSF